MICILFHFLKDSSISLKNIFHIELSTDRFQSVYRDECEHGEKEVNYFTLLIRQQCPRCVYTTVHTFHAVRFGHKRGRNREAGVHKKGEKETTERLNESEILRGQSENV